MGQWRLMVARLLLLAQTFRDRGRNVIIGGHGASLDSELVRGEIEAIAPACSATFMAGVGKPNMSAAASRWP